MSSYPIDLYFSVNYTLFSSTGDEGPGSSSTGFPTADDDMFSRLEDVLGGSAGVQQILSQMIG